MDNDDGFYADLETDSDDSFLTEESVPSKEIAMRKISFAFADLEDQIRNGEKTLILRTSYESSKHQMKYTKSTEKKLERDWNCLQQVYDLLENDKKSTKRELYYEKKALYGDQRNLDRCITSICQLLDEERGNLNILSCSRGLLRGAVTFLASHNGVIDARVQNVLISDSLIESELISEAQFILVVEKDTTFQKLLDEKFQSIFPNAILATSKGYPDISTRNVIKSLTERLKIPVFGIFDADPHGIEIYLTYKYGKDRDQAESRGAFVPNIEWIGLFPSDIHNFLIAASQRLPLQNLDHTKIKNMITRSIHLGEYRVTQELDFMMRNGFKMELEAVNLCGEEYMARLMIAPRIMTREEDVLWEEEEKNKVFETFEQPVELVDSDAEFLIEHMMENDSD